MSDITPTRHRLSGRASMVLATWYDAEFDEDNGLEVEVLGTKARLTGYLPCECRDCDCESRRLTVTICPCGARCDVDEDYCDECINAPEEAIAEAAE